MKARKSFFILILVCLFGCWMPYVAASQDAVKVKATVLVASNEGDDFNFDNDAYRDQLIQLFSYSAYEQLDLKLLELIKSERVKMDLPDGYELLLTFQGFDGDRAMVQALIRKNNIQYVFTVLSIQSPGVVFLGGPPVGKGVLVIVLETGF